MTQVQENNNNHPQKKQVMASVFNWPEIVTWQRVLIIFVAFILTLLIAFNTRYGNNPDEDLHIDAFRYYEKYWWPPDLGSDNVVYSVYGWSRVYSGEIVYLIYGKLGAISRIMLASTKTIKASYVVYRMINVVLFLVTLIAVFFLKTKSVNTSIIGLVFLCIPQVYYVYAYANSDAFGLSLCVFLFLIAIRLADKPILSWKWSEILLASALAGLILTSKKSFQFALIVPFALIAWRGLRSIFQEKDVTISWLGVRLLVASLVIVAIAAPMRYIYPLTQDDYRRTRKEMRDEKGKGGRTPGNPSHSTYHLDDKGVTYRVVLQEWPWLKDTTESFYALFGYWSVRSSAWVYRSVRLGVLVSMFLTLFTALTYWNKLHENLKITLILSPIVFLLNFLASLRFSLRTDYQPQGRYLFPTLIAFCFLVMGTIFEEKEFVGRIRLMLYVIFYFICIFTLVTLVILNPDL